MGQLWTLVQAYVDRHGTSERQLAKRLGYSSSSSFDIWRHPKSIPGAVYLARFAGLSGTPYQRVLDAVLADAGYLPEPDVAPVTMRHLSPADVEALQGVVDQVVAESLPLAAKRGVSRGRAARREQDEAGEAGGA